MKNKGELLGAMVLFSQIGITIFVTVGVFLIIGYFLDSWLNTGFIFIFIFAFLGIIAAMRNMYILVSRQFLNKKDNAEENK